MSVSTGQAKPVEVQAHTPGPWAVHRSWPSYVVPAAHAHRSRGISIYPDRNRTDYAFELCHVGGIETWGDAKEYRSESSHVSLEEAQANARLIAAAPDYHRAAMLFDSWMNSPTGPHGFDMCGSWFKNHNIESDYVQPIDYIHSLFRAAITRATTPTTTT